MAAWWWAAKGEGPKWLQTLQRNYAAVSPRQSSQKNSSREDKDSKLHNHHASFRQDRSCTDNVATAHIIIEQSLGWSFIYSEKVFDSKYKETLWKLLGHYGIPKIISLVQSSYQGMSRTFTHGGQLLHLFEVKLESARDACCCPPVHTWSHLDHENFYKRKKEWHTVRTVVTAWQPWLCQWPGFPVPQPCTDAG